MRVLMFGWEFPPHITGGLGTACYGLTKALSEYEDLKVTFVVPKAFGDEDKSVASFVNAEEVAVNQGRIFDDYLLAKGKYSHQSDKMREFASDRMSGDLLKKIKYIEIASLIKPYISPEQYEKLNTPESEHQFIVKDDGHVVIVIDGQEIEIHFPSSTRTESNSKTFFNFSGSYGTGLITEVTNYAKVAAEIAVNEEFDIIHAHDWLTYQAGVAAKRVSGKKLVIHVHATEFDRSGENVNQIGRAHV